MWFFSMQKRESTCKEGKKNNFFIMMEEILFGFYKNFLIDTKLIGSN